MKATDLMARINKPILFTPTHGGRHAFGYEAEILPDICDYVLECHDAEPKSKETPSKNVVACYALVRALAKVGIIALVDEATGYQFDRARNALARILEKFIVRTLNSRKGTFNLFNC